MQAIPRSATPTQAAALVRRATFLARIEDIAAAKPPQQPKWRTVFVRREGFKIDPWAPRCAWPRPEPTHRNPGDLIPFAEVLRAVCEVYGVTKADLIGPGRTRRIALARHVAMYLAAKLSRLSLPDIGRRFGGRDHTTALYAVQKIDALTKDGRHEVVAAVEAARGMIYGAAA